MRNPLVRKTCGPLFSGLALDEVVGELFKAPFSFSLGLVETGPAVDVYVKDDSVIAKAELPGIRPEDVKLSVDGTVLTIRGEKKQESEIKKEQYYHAESVYGSFTRTIELPVDVKAEDAKATYKNGVLTVRFPKAESPRKKEIKIDIG